MARLSMTSAVTQAFVAALFGLIVLPTLFVTTATAGIATGGAISLGAGTWLAVAVVLSLWLLALVPGLATGIAAWLDRLTARDRSVAGRPVRRVGSVGAARLLVVVVVVVLVQAIVRRPLVAVLGVIANPLTVEAIFAAGTLALLLIILVWLHQTARPLVEAVTWQALDALVATSGSEAAARLAADVETEASTVSGRAASGTTQSDAATIAESSRQSTNDGPPATVATPADGAALVAPGDATLAAAEEATHPDPFSHASTHLTPSTEDPDSATLPEHLPLDPRAPAVAEATLPGDTKSA